MLFDGSFVLHAAVATRETLLKRLPAKLT